MSHTIAKTIVVDGNRFTLDDAIADLEGRAERCGKRENVLLKKMQRLRSGDPMHDRHFLEFETTIAEHAAWNTAIKMMMHVRDGHRND